MLEMGLFLGPRFIPDSLHHFFPIGFSTVDIDDLAPCSFSLLKS